MIVCAIVPSHNHWQALGQVVAALRAAQLPVFIVDDGSEPAAAAAIAALHDPAGGVEVHRFEVNQGKGAAVIEGFRRTLQAGFTHAVQVDADGQHDLHALPRLLARAAAHPGALVSGQPIFDETMRTNRKVGRWITHVWVWIETLSLTITDSMCGFRVYPLAPVQALLAEESVGRRMDFDTELMVRLYWRGTKVLMEPVRVTYPPGNTSNFDMLRDNWGITKMHTRLVFGMLRRLPVLLWRWPRRPGSDGLHWTAMAERGAYWGLRFCTAAYRLLGRRVCMVVIAPIVLYFYAAGPSQRRASRLFLGRALGRPPTRREKLRHFLSFAGRALDVFAGWTGDIPASALIPTDPVTLRRVAADPRGALLVVAHLGNVDLSRAVLDPATRARLTVLTHTRHSVNYNRVLAEFRPEAAVNLVQVTEMGPEFAMALKQRVERGEWVVIAGDRTPVGGAGRISRVPFLGLPAPFPQGPWILASLLECPVYLLFCLRREGDRWALTLEPFAERVDLPRAGRVEMLEALCARYAGRLEEYARAATFQWFNFFDFWGHEARE